MAVGVGEKRNAFGRVTEMQWHTGTHRRGSEGRNWRME